MAFLAKIGATFLFIFGSLWSGTLGVLHISQTPISTTTSSTSTTIGFSGIQGFTGPGLYTLQDEKIYYDGILVPGADSTFALIKNKNQLTGYAKDKNHVYNAYYATIISNADPSTFTVLNNWYAKDKNQVYSYNPIVVMDGGYSVGTPILGADPTTFSLVSGQSTYDAQDKNHKYLDGQIVQEPSLSASDEMGIKKAVAVYFGADVNFVVLQMVAQSEQFYSFTETHTGADVGGRMVAQKNSDGTFTILLHTQSDPYSCNEVTKYKIPKEVVSACISDDGQIVQ